MIQFSGFRVVITDKVWEVALEYRFLLDFFELATDDKQQYRENSGKVTICSSWNKKNETGSIVAFDNTIYNGS